MSKSVKQQRRPYRSAVRTEQVALTRQRIVDAAADMFIERGYANTTISAVATAAGISQETIYGAFGGKRGLLEAVIDGRIPLMPERDADLEAIERLATSDARLRAFVAFCCRILASTSPIHEVIRGAADSESFAIELRGRLLRERLASQKRHLEQHIRPDLRAGLTLRQAADRFCALTSPELHHLMISQLGWTQQRYEVWVAELAERDLLTS